MSTKRILAEIAAVTEEDIARMELPQENSGERIGGPITDTFLKQLAVLYYRGEAKTVSFCIGEYDAGMSPEEFFDEWTEGLRLVLLGNMFDYELQMRYGRYLSREDIERKVILEIREGWLVYKVFCDEDDDSYEADERPALLN